MTDEEIKKRLNFLAHDAGFKDIQEMDRAEKPLTMSIARFVRELNLAEERGKILGALFPNRELLSEKYDAYFDAITGKWSSKTCGNKKCNYCKNRPKQADLNAERKFRDKQAKWYAKHTPKGGKK